CLVCVFVFFFFSSRRRHTRSKRDWSSDVCSSDLDALVLAVAGLVSQIVERRGRDGRRQLPDWLLAHVGPAQRLGNQKGNTVSTRSEERRVGKECRYRGSRER